MSRIPLKMHLLSSFHSVFFSSSGPPTNANGDNRKITLPIILLFLLLAASGGSDPPSCADAEPGDFESDARCGAHDDDTFHGGLIFRVSHTEYTKGMPEKQIFPEKRKNPGGFSLSYRFFPGFGFSPWSGVSSAVRCSAVSRAGAMRSR